MKTLLTFCVLSILTTRLYAVCDNGYYLSNGSCVDCGNQYYCNNDTRYSCWDVNPHPNLVNMASVVVTGDDVTLWGTQNAWDVSHCMCDWSFSDERRETYLQERKCIYGPGGTTYT